jgi:hypothetical protein
MGHILDPLNCSFYHMLSYVVILRLLSSWGSKPTPLLARRQEIETVGYRLNVSLLAHSCGAGLRYTSVHGDLMHVTVETSRG